MRTVVRLSSKQYNGLQWLRQCGSGFSIVGMVQEEFDFFQLTSEAVSFPLFEQPTVYVPGLGLLFASHSTIPAVRHRPAASTRNADRRQRRGGALEWSERSVLQLARGLLSDPDQLVFWVHSPRPHPNT
jgi:hypothetical protein